MASPVKTLSRGIIYLNNIREKLRDLRGFSTLAHELIQNAEDSEGVTWMCFDVRDDALIVDNDGVFSDCGLVEEESCPWKREKGHMCDFHRFRLVSSGDKREEKGKKGAFGIGFIAVYQVTDSPELISAGRHWTVHEERPERERIIICDGCPKCSGDDLPSTRFILPWAKDSNSYFRKELKVEAIDNNKIEDLFHELNSGLPIAMIFLDHIEKIDLKRNGRLVKSIQKLREQDSLIITDGMPQNDKIWHLIYGNFVSEARELRRKYPDLIERKRTANVTLAIPQEAMERGLFYAFLPTKQTVGIPLHINADFFTRNDRKGIIFENDYQSEWNRAAISAAASAFIDNILTIRNKISHVDFWTLIEATSRVYKEPGKELRDHSLKSFWEKLYPKLRELDLVYSTQESWKTPSEILLLEKPEEETIIPILEKLNIAIVHPDLRRFYSLLRKDEIGVQLLDFHHIADALERIGLTRRVARSELPSCLQHENALHALWHELNILYERSRTEEKKKEAKRRFLQIAIALGRDGALWPCGEIYHADSDTVALFEAIDSTIPFLAELGEKGKFLKHICPPFTLEVAVERLSRLSQESLLLAMSDGRLKPANLLGWFESRQKEIFTSEKLKQKLAQLPIFPTTSGLRPLSELGLPGDFEDPIGLADIIDLQQLGERRKFLKNLGAKELTFSTYARDHIPRAFRDPSTPLEKKQKALRLLADRRGKIVDDPSIKKALTETKIVECEDGIFRKPDEVYFRNDLLSKILGDKVCFAVIPEGHEAAVKELYTWLGVVETPRDIDIVARIEELTKNPPNDESRAAIQLIFEHLSKKPDLTQAEELAELRMLSWLPSVNDSTQWFRPQDLYIRTIAHLFETQGNFLDVAPAFQTENILKFLSIKTKPEVSLVVAHLLECAVLNKEVHKGVYHFLNDNYSHPHIAKLQGVKCLLLSNGNYVRPDQVFWSENPFGRFRYQLGSELRTYNNLFNKLGVKEKPDYTDAIKVIKEIHAEYGTKNNILNEDDYNVLYECWRILEQALKAKTIKEEDFNDLINLKVIPNKKKLLNLPEHMFFEDRAGLAAKFDEFLENNVIPRPQEAWKAMAAVGVRSLSSVVRSNLHDCENRRQDKEVAERIQERRLQLERVIESTLSGTDLKVNKNLLEHLRCYAVSNLSIYYSVLLFNQERHSTPEEATAHFQQEESCLYFMRRDGQPPWHFISRELALAFCPETEPGGLALGIKEVLAAESEAEARRSLDELGFAPLEKGPIDDTPPNIAALGGVEESGQGPPPPPISIERDEHRPPGHEGQTLSGDGPGIGAGTTRLVQAHSDPGQKRQGARSKLRTYVFSSGRKPEGGEEDPERQAHRRKVDQAGIEKVLDYEKRAGRTPKDMGPTHEGYDIESRGEDGEIARYIEVKSLSGDWDPMGVQLTKPQFEKARKLGEKYWLYVVERAESGESCIRRINDPARKVTEFRYDDGWRALAEEDHG